MTDKPRVTRLHHLRPLPDPQPNPETPRPGTHNREVSETSRAAGQTISLSLTLLAAAHHMTEGEFQVGITAICDALWIQHKGNHEQMTDHEMLTAIRRLGGFGWTPDEPGEAA